MNESRLPRWAKEYIQRGPTAYESLTPKDVAILRAVQRKYGQDYERFLKELSSSLPPESRLNKHVQETYELLSSVTRLVGVALGSEGRAANQQELEELFQSISPLDVSVSTLSEAAAKVKKYRTTVQQVEQRTGMSFEQLEKTQSQVKERMYALGPSRWERLKTGYQELEAKSPFLQGTRVAGDALLNATLGPFANVGRAAISGVGALWKSYAEKRRVRREKEMFARLTPQAQFTPEGVFESYEAMRGAGTRYRGFEKGAMPAGYTAAQERGTPISSQAEPPAAAPAPVSRPLVAEPVGAPVVGGKAGPAAQQVAMGNFLFFSKQAFVAPYTKMLLEAIQKSKGAGGGGMFDMAGLSGFIAKILPYVVGAVGVALAAGGIAWATKAAISAMEAAKEKGWLTGQPGKELARGQKVAAFSGGFLGGGPGLGEKGGVGNVLKGMGKGALIGAGLSLALAPFTGGVSLAALPAILGGAATAGAIGAGIGGGLHALGGRRVMQGLQNLWRATPIGMAQEGIKGFREGGFTGMSQNLRSAMTYGLIKPYQEVQKEATIKAARDQEAQFVQSLGKAATPEAAKVKETPEFKAQGRGIFKGYETLGFTQGKARAKTGKEAAEEAIVAKMKQQGFKGSVWEAESPRVLGFGAGAGRLPVKEVPEVDVNAQMDRRMEVMGEQTKSAVKEAVAGVGSLIEKKMLGSQATATRQFRDEVFNLRDPLVELMNKGILSIGD